MESWCVLLVPVLMAVITAEPHVVRRNLQVWNEVDNDLVFSQDDKKKPSPPVPCMDPNKCSKTGCEKVYVVESSIKTNWFEAFHSCSRRGWRLASVGSESEQKQLEKTLKEAGSLKEVWLGATDLGQTGFTWMATGKPVVFSRWYPGEPSSGRKFEPCVLLFNVGSQYQWFNVVCNHHHPFACEYFRNSSSEDIDVDWRSFL